MRRARVRATFGLLKKALGIDAVGMPALIWEMHPEQERAFERKWLMSLDARKRDDVPNVPRYVGESKAKLLRITDTSLLDLMDGGGHIVASSRECRIPIQITYRTGKTYSI